MTAQTDSLYNLEQNWYGQNRRISENVH